MDPQVDEFGRVTRGLCGRPALTLALRQHGAGGGKTAQRSIARCTGCHEYASGRVPQASALKAMPA